MVFRSRKEFDAARRAVIATTGEDGQQVLTPAECLALEPALQLDVGELAGGIFTASEQVGDCAAFCAGLTFRLRRQRNVEWLLGADVIGPVRSGGRLVAVDTGKGQVQADRFVLCMGAASSAFARACGFYLPIYPLKGYSITLTQAPGARVLRHSVTDMERKLVFAPLRAMDTRQSGLPASPISNATRRRSTPGASTSCAALRRSCSASTLPATSSRGADFVP